MLDVKRNSVYGTLPGWMIVGFRDKRTETFHRGRRIAAFSGFDRSAWRKLDQLDAAVDIRDLIRPGNRLEALKGDRRGQWSIRINDRWRICFEWPTESPGPANVKESIRAVPR